MQRTLPRVEGGWLYQPGRRSPIIVGTPPWFDWLERHGAFTFVDPASTFNAHKISSYPGGPTWEASSGWEDQCPSIWLGSSSTLTLERLQAAARTLVASQASAEPAASEYWTGDEQPSLAGALPKTKLTRPRLRSDVIPRPHLLERLSAELDGPLTLLCAPAGYGKTTLLAQWLATLSRPVAWLSLDEQDNELAVFLHGLIASLQRAVPDTCQASASVLRAPRLPPPQKIAVLLLNDLADIPEDVLVVLDDYHLILTSEIHTLLAQLVEYLPQHIHMVLASRTEPLLPMARWHARGLIHELHATDLRFTLQETQSFLSKQLGDDMACENAQALMERTEGWVAMLHLAALSLRDTAAREAFMDRFDRTLGRSMSVYLIEEALAQLPPGEQEALVRMSLVEQFNAELGAAILDNGVTAGQMQALLEEWERANPFVVPLETRQEWYRLHHLMKQGLEQRLRARTSPEELTGLHRRASRWYAGRGLIDEALQHAMAAGDVSGAAQLVEAQVLPAYEQEQWKQLERWMRLLPEEQIQSSPFLLVARAWIMQYKGQLKEHSRVLTAAEALDATFGDSTAPTLDVLARQLDKSLLYQEEREGEEPRLLILETVHEYGLEVLAARGEDEFARRTHSAYYLARAEGSGASLCSSDTASWSRHLEQDQGIFREALRFFLARQDVEEAQRLAAALRRFWELGGSESESYRALVRGLEADHTDSTAPSKREGLCAVATVSTASREEVHPMAVEQVLPGGSKKEHLSADATQAPPPLPSPVAARPAGLTKREFEVLTLVVQGLSNALIAAQLVISPTTVHSYLRSIYSKLGVTSRLGAMRYAINHQLL